MGYTKIVATIGPVSHSPEVILRLLQAGVDVFRLNMSHGDQEGHAQVVKHIREAGRQLNRPVGILCDLSGPKIRIGNLAQPVLLEPGDHITITTEDVEGCANQVSVNYPGFPLDVQPGQRVMLDDGMLEWEVIEVQPPRVKCLVVRGGPLSSRKGLNLPHTRLGISSLTEKDRDDIEWGLENDVDLFAVSFVKRASDVRDARAYMRSLGGDLPLFAKIEKGEAVEDIEEIMKAADGAMVARGDLGVEIPIEQVPHVQKRVISLCNRLGKPVITATQMLDSMIRSARPTRAEVTDVANAILDGTDAVMLSGETATGLYAEAAVAMMRRISMETEQQMNYGKRLEVSFVDERHMVADAVSHSTALVARELSAPVLCLTLGGSTPRRVARYRPQGGVLAYCTSQRTAQQLCLSWGVTAVTRTESVDLETERRQGSEAQILRAICLFQDRGYLASGTRLVVAAGLPIHEPDTTNLLRVVNID